MITRFQLSKCEQLIDTRPLVGLALRKDPVIKLPAHLEPMRLNATHENASMHVLIDNMVREVMSMGRYGLTAVMGRVSHEQQLWAVRSEKRCGVEPAPPLFPLRATVLMPYEPSPSLSLLRL